VATTGGGDGGNHETWTLTLCLENPFGLCARTIYRLWFRTLLGSEWVFLAQMDLLFCCSLGSGFRWCLAVKALGSEGVFSFTPHEVLSLFFVSRGNGACRTRLWCGYIEQDTR